MARAPKAYFEQTTQKHICKSREEYKGVKWTCTGSSRISEAKAKKAWAENYEKKRLEIDNRANRKTGKVKLQKAMQEWYDTYKRQEVVKGRPRSARTIQTDEDTMKQIFSALGSKIVCDIDSDMIQKYFLTVVRDGASDSTIKKRWDMLSMYFRYEYPDGGNPMLRCSKPKSKKNVQKHMIVDDDEPTDKIAYTDGEMACLAAELGKPYNVHVHAGGERGYLYGGLLIVIMYEFLRVSEATELRVKDIDWERNVIRVRRQYDEHNKLITPPKYGSRREVPIVDVCRSILQEACAGKQQNDLLFRAGTLNSKSLQHDGHIMQLGLRRILYAACERVGVERHTIHDLRHDGISRLVRAGAKPQSIQKWAGHKSLTITMDLYYRDDGQHDADDMELVTGISESVYVG